MTERPTALQVVEGIDLSDKACVITGASSGLGRESARALAAAGARMVLAARNHDALAQSAEWIRAEVPGARMSTVHLDLTVLSSVRAAAAAIRELTPVIHVLMNNAGVMFTPFDRTHDGFEMQIGTNYFGHFELTRLLVPQLAAAGNARIVILSSRGHRLGNIDLDDPNWERRDYDKFAAYGASKRRTSCTPSRPTGACARWESAPTPCTPAPSPRRWRGTCPARTSPGYANTPAGASIPSGPNTVRPRRFGRR
ncbi:hypothetical protein MOKP76_23850 [Mycobacterium avium subsp. hominissuis]|uniref:Short chain dehydrogenase family protein n=2 Tax=Mycobacterium avium complex (MAC) TaxID=120793 RepID=A0AAI8X270_MYCAV|nr:hypothetical protein JPH1_46940 [Mycobacterium avium subsp. hominissuis]